MRARWALSAARSGPISGTVRRPASDFGPSVGRQGCPCTGTGALDLTALGARDGRLGLAEAVVAIVLDQALDHVLRQQQPLTAAAGTPLG
jgi:hypothetical protein